MKSSPVRILAALAIIAGLVAFEAIRLTSRRGKTPAPANAPSAYGCVADEPRAVTGPRVFTEIAAESGIDFQHVVGPLGTYFMPESVGAGGALFDYDGDGRLDVYLVNSGRTPEAPGDLPPGTRVENRLFRQVEQGQFVDVTETSGLGDTGYGMGCAVGDVDNDGHPDVYITNYGADRLYRNLGDGTFKDVTDRAGIRNEEWGTSAAFFDYDRDGWLDLIVVNYTSDPTYGHLVGCGFRKGLVSYCGPHKFLPTVDRLFRNEGLHTDESGSRSVRFRDVTAEAGLDQADTFGFGVVCADFSADGWPDIFVANDAAPNRLWVNQHDGRFAEEAVPRGVAYNAIGAAEAGMGVAVGDVDFDERPDLVVTHLSRETTTLYVHEIDGYFRDDTERSGLGPPTYPGTGWGAALVDLNHDGYLDLPLVNGLVIPCHSGFPFHGEDAFQVRHDTVTDPEAYWRDYADLNVLLMGAEGARFRDVSDTGGDFCAAAASGRSLIYGDVDSDGDVDLLVTNCGGPARLYRNDFPKDGHWLSLRVVDERLRRDAYGAEVRVRAGGRVHYRLASPASSYLASNDPRVHIGLGEADHYDEVVITWPDGPLETATEVFPGGEADRAVTIRRGAGRVLKANP